MPHDLGIPSCPGHVDSLGQRRIDSAASKGQSQGQLVQLAGLLPIAVPEVEPVQAQARAARHY